MPTLELPTHLLNEVESGHVVLLLGAGASRGAKNANGGNPPLASELAGLIAKKFLTSKYSSLPLNQVAAYAISASDLFTFQAFVAEIFSGFQPSEAHLKLTGFRWKGIATTNYDTLIEDSYLQSKRTAAQGLVRFIDHSDRPDDLLVDPNYVLCMKLHGCITRPNIEPTPFIFTTEQYNTHLNNRLRLFNRLYDWAAEKPILFAGYSLQDANLLGLIQRVQREVPSSPRSFLVTKGIDDIQRVYWEKYRITAINGSFDELMASLDTNVRSLFRGIRITSEPGQLPISDRFVRRDTNLTFNTTQFLERDVDYVKSVIPREMIEPKQFYKGVNSEWAAIDQDLDVQRHLTDTLLTDHIVDDANPHTGRCFIVIKAHAGSGKTVLLQRLAWDASRRFDKLCLKLRPGGFINTAALLEISDQTASRIYLFIDNLIERRREIEVLYHERSLIRDKVTVIAAARTNEWNTAPDSLTSLASDVYDLPYLSRKEVDGLLKKLEANNALGTLEKLKPDERRAAFLDLADRQLLVALHEATLGKPFVDIIKDEYDGITPSRAQHMYLSVCLLYQFGSPVRAGIISRMYGIPFEEFQASFFKPLEQIIITSEDMRSCDMCYMARHPHIAEIVVTSVLDTKEVLFHEVLKVIGYLNPSYNSDKTAFRKLLNGKSLLNTFPDHEMVSKLFMAAKEVSGEDEYLLQQQCIYEMHRPNGNLVAAEALINKALSISNSPRVLQHTQSELFVRRAEAAMQPLVRKNYLTEATKICEQLRSTRDDPYPYFTLVKIKIMQIRDEIDAEESSNEQIQVLARKADKLLQDGIARHPDNPFLRSAEADLATVLEKYDQALKAMERSFELDHRGSLIALRLASHYAKGNNVEKSTEILRKAIAAKPSDVRLHLAYAKLLINYSLGTDDEIIHYLKKSFVSNDHNGEPRLLLGRQLFLTGSFDESKSIFAELRHMYMAPDVRYRLRFGTTKTHVGDITKIEATYCIITRSGDGVTVYCSRNDIGEDAWRATFRGCRVRFNLAFCMNGPRAYNLEAV
jgi:tetratricopeptide (TPR) repeat protein